MSESSPRALLVNKWVPPDTPPTARLLADLGRALEERGWDVEFVGRGAGYREQPRGLVRRLADDVAFHLRLLGRGLFRRDRADVVVSLTSPPGLVVTASLFARASGARHYHWCMDLFPDVATALGKLRDGGPVERLVRFLMARGYRGCSQIVALDADMAERFAKFGLASEILPPWPPDYPAALTGTPEGGGDAAAEDGSTWLYSGNLGRAHEWRTLLEAQRLLEERGSPLRLVFQGGGPELPRAREEAERMGLRQVAWRGYAAEPELVRQLVSVRALVATQHPITRGMLHPSKLSTFTLTDTPIVWVGDLEGAVARELESHAARCQASPGDAATVAAFLEQLPPPTPSEAPCRLEEFRRAVAERRERDIARWVAWAEEKDVSPPAGMFQRRGNPQNRSG